jgi:hypothetical protein
VLARSPQKEKRRDGDDKQEQRNLKTVHYTKRVATPSIESKP